MPHDISLTDHELHILQDTDFLRTKARALSKVEVLLTRTREALESVVADSSLYFPHGARLAGGKIARGENYRGLPYRVLDQPALLTADDIFAFRTMFWWGHFFSATLHLQGLSLERYRNGLMDQLEELAAGGLYLSVGPTPWEYHYGRDNYVLIQPAHRAHLERCSFLKLSRRLELGEWKRLPEFAAASLHGLLGQLSAAAR